MTFDHNPQHGARSLATRTLASVFATVVLIAGLLSAVTEIPASIVRTFDGPQPTVPVVEVLPAEPDRVLVCMGAGLSFGASTSEPVAYGAPSEVLAGIDPALSTLIDTTVLDGFSLEGAPSGVYPSVVSLPASGGSLAGVSFQSLSNLNVRGLAVSECQEPRTETWLVGGDTSTGRQAALSLSNPGKVPATVNVEIWGAAGPISAPLGQGILVQPGAQRVLSLAGLAPSEASPVIRITSTGVGVVAALHASIVRGLVADGLSVVTGQPAPSVERAIPGVYLAPEDVIGPIKGKEGYADVAGAIRVLSPLADASVTVRIVRAAGGETTTQLDLVAGQVRDLALVELGSGDVGIIVESSEPVVAAVRQSVGTDQATDTSWVGSSYPLLGTAALAVPAVGESRVTIVNTGEASVAVNFDGRDVEIPAGGAVTRPVSTTHQLIAPAPVFAAMSVRGESIIGNVQVLPTPEPQESVRLIVR
ncbi:MAG: hypothetical protein HOJ98_06130 [Microbacteriaceae bacterium]|nr:hypothetical protein [Microbacteriaceae bacterium]